MLCGLREVTVAEIWDLGLLEYLDAWSDIRLEWIFTERDISQHRLTRRVLP